MQMLISLIEKLNELNLIQKEEKNMYKWNYKHKNKQKGKDTIFTTLVTLSFHGHSHRFR